MIKTPFEIGVETQKQSKELGKCTFGKPFDNLRASSEFERRRLLILNQS
jgi:hypothetical protein